MVLKLLKKINRRTITLVFGFSLMMSTLYLNAQDIHFSQYDVHSLFLGPQNAGVLSDLRVASSYRQQWSALAPFTTIAASADGGVEIGHVGNKLGIGLLFLKDDAGTANLKTIGFNVDLSYNLLTSKNGYLAFGIGGGVFQNSINAAGHQWESQFVDNAYDPTVASGEDFSSQSRFIPDLSAGISYAFKGKVGNHITRSSYGRREMLIGATISHLLAPQLNVALSDDKLLRKFSVFSEFKIPVHDQLLIEPMFIGMLQGKAKTFVIGNNFVFVTKQNSKYTNHANARAFGLSTHYRYGDAVILGMFLDFNKLRLRATYDFNISGLTKATNTLGGYEIGLSYEMNFLKGTRYHRIR